MKVWNATVNTLESALNLRKGSLIADVGGFNAEVSFETERVYEAADLLKARNIDKNFFSQAALLVYVQQNDIAFQDWATRLVTAL